MSALFSKPRIPTPLLAAPPTMPAPTAPKGLLDAELAQLGRRQGLVAALFGARTPSGSSQGKRLTGE